MSLEGEFENETTVEAMSKLAEAVDRVDQEMKLLKSSLQSSETISQLKFRIKCALERNDSSDVNNDSGDVNVVLATPLKNTNLNTFDDDFPSTPTLEELGLSGPTLSIVGRRLGAFDSNSRLSDAEFDNSFYQKSPNGVDNSFSSDVSVPNFRIFNSSPATATRNEPRRAKSHNLKQVTTAASVLVDCVSEDSSMIVDEEPLTKKVHFSEDLENKILNK